MVRTRIAALIHAVNALIFLSGFGTSAALGQSANWEPAVTAGGSWGNPSNWQGGIVPGGSGNSASFALDFNPMASVTLDGDRVIGTIFSTGANPWNLDSGPLDTLTVAKIDVTGGTLMVNTPLAGIHFAKDGTGVLSFSNPNASYSGIININAGTLKLVGSGNYSTGSNVLHLATGAILDVTQLTAGLRFGGADTRLNVQNGDELNGTGIVNGGLKVKSGGTVYPGDDGVGTLFVDGKGLFEAGSNWKVNLDTASIGDSNTNNRLNFNNDLTLEPGMNMPIDGTGLTFAAGEIYDYRISSGATSFDIGAVNFQPFNFGMFGSPDYFSFLTIGDNLLLRFAPVPEPATMLLIGVAGGVWMIARRRKIAK